MNTNETLERMVTDRLASDAAGYDSDRALDDALALTSRMRPYPQWLALMKEPPMRIPSRVVVGSPTLRLAMILALTLALALALGGAVVAGASLLPGQPLPEPYGPARNGSLLYDKDGDIYLADAEGGNPRAIITSEADARYPSFSHDGTRILFGRGPEEDLEAMVANADGTDVRHAFPDAQFADFLPGKARLVATRTVDDHLVLSVIDLDGGEIRDLDIGDIEPRGWVVARPPDGQEVIFTGHPNPGSKDLGIFAIRPDGSGLRTIGAISTTESGDGAVGNQISFQDPALSPDGSTVGYWNWELKDATATSPDAYLHLRDLTSGEEFPILFGRDDHNGLLLRFSPDGTMVVYDSGPSADLSQMNYAPVDGSVPARLVGAPFPNTTRVGFDFSPDGTKVILAQTSGSAVIDLTTGETTPVLQGIPALPGWQRLAP